MGLTAENGYLISTVVIISFRMLLICESQTREWRWRKGGSERALVFLLFFLRLHFQNNSPPFHLPIGGAGCGGEGGDGVSVVCITPLQLDIINLGSFVAINGPAAD